MSNSKYADNRPIDDDVGDALMTRYRCRLRLLLLATLLGCYWDVLGYWPRINRELGASQQQASLLAGSYRPLRPRHSSLHLYNVVMVTAMTSLLPRCLYTTQ